ncbi:Hsp20/alpha crystallin family protein [Desulfurivibrio alkaliphilus]|uniref:Heat shock protein Hsp20 n=1 Tax=Desulfurivibrio alkaliphilus (strain DSM 19089 / UNIQEM U267 / AHT2) TaxID=589865 RepID=D6Z0F6_DESAT|nr:Hsp20/alpha crystallin family protein [Desulfurivibrio alkaliphilus]ADH85185.1 heat shock protein Hsp20 [Desulfurivibrio alkaliphilus AHT 2]
MDIKKFSPWNWFKKENEESGSVVPVRRRGGEQQPTRLPAGRLQDPITQLHREMDRLFENAFRGFGLSPLMREGLTTPVAAGGLLRPSVDITAGDQEYTITVEVPGVVDEDVKVEISGDTMTISGEKKQEKEEKEKDYYRMERSYGSFQRVLSLPDDADADGVAANFKNGVLTITVPRRPTSDKDVKQIEIKSS